MNNIQVFNYQDKPVRTVQHDNDTWWVLKDVCDVLGLSDVSMTAKRIDDDEKQTITIKPEEILTESVGVQKFLDLTQAKLVSGQARNMVCVNEPGLYAVILRSDKPEAKEFKRWITHEVLPSIRKNGSYIAGQENMTNEQVLASALLLAKSVIDEKDAHIAILEPKADYTDRVLQSDSLLPITKIAKDYGMSGKAFNELLCEIGIQYRMGRTWLLYADHDDKGYTQSRTHIINDSGNTVVHTYWTQRGRQFLYNFLAKKRNLRPVAERLVLS